MSPKELNSSLNNRSTSSTSSKSGKRANQARQRISPRRILAIGMSAVALGGVGVAVASDVQSGNKSKQQQGLLDKGFDRVLGEVNSGQLDPNDVTAVTVKTTDRAYNVAAKIEGEDAVDPNDPVIGEVIKQTPNASWANTTIQAGTPLIVEKADVSGNPPSLAQEVQTGEQFPSK
jgi:hypothetical protein